MILTSSNWKPSITRSCGKSCNFNNQVFETDKLKIEVSIINKNLQFQILPLVLTVSYLENIDDQVFSIAIGTQKPLITLVDNLQSYPFKLLLENPNKFQCQVKAQTPKQVQSKSSSNTFTDSHSILFSSFSPSQITINSMGVNYGASDPAAAANAVSTTQNLSYVPASAGVVQVAPATPTRAHGGSITNNSNSDVYISFGATVPAANIGLPLLPKVKAGIPSNIDIPEDYKGQIQAFCVTPANGNAITGGLNVMDFTYL